MWNSLFFPKNNFIFRCVKTEHFLYSVQIIFVLELNRKFPTWYQSLSKLFEGVKEAEGRISCCNNFSNIMKTQLRKNPRYFSS